MTKGRRLTVLRDNFMGCRSSFMGQQRKFGNRDFVQFLFGIYDLFYRGNSPLALNATCSVYCYGFGVSFDSECLSFFRIETDTSFGQTDFV